MPSPQTPSIAGTALDPTSLRPPIADAEIFRVSPAELRARLIALRDEGLAMLLDVGAVDYLERDPRYDVAYHMLALSPAMAGEGPVATPRRVRVLVGVPADATTLPSVADLWPSADWAEREIFDLFGIVFEGHPDLKRIQMPYDWEGHPLRKDYPLRGPAREATPRPAFALKSNVPAGAPPAGKVAEALQRQIARARGQAEPAAPKDGEPT
jgi:NADH-quinone oxidoreductase subunit C